MNNELEQPLHRISVLPDGSIITHPSKQLEKEIKELGKELADRESKQLELEKHLELPKYRVFVDKKLGEVYRRE